jgi:hypothetical protein
VFVPLLPRAIVHGELIRAAPCGAGSAADRLHDVYPIDRSLTGSSKLKGKIQARTAKRSVRVERAEDGRRCATSVRPFATVTCLPG